jgi:DNA-directed RNA polymerase specialized sigma subunit
MFTKEEESLIKKCKGKIKKGEALASQSGMHMDTLNGRFKTSIVSMLIGYKHENNLTNVELSKKMKISESQVSRILAYHLKSISLDYLVDCIDRLGMNETHLLSLKIKKSVA